MAEPGFFLQTLTSRLVDWVFGRIDTYIEEEPDQSKKTLDGKGIPKTKKPPDKKVSIKTLSAGQLQKISFIRALLSDVDILLLDESTSNLDENSRKLIFNILNESDFTIINCTHNHQDFEYDEHLKIIIKDEKRLISTV